MLKTLILKNLVLIEKTEVGFEKGFTTITGETGAGKTVLIEALRLILGERTDASKVRKGCEKALIQASFSLNDSSALHKLFEETGLTLSEKEDLILTREISSAGKSRAYACGQMVPIAFLQKIAPHLIDFIGQHSQIQLKNSDQQRQFLDLYANVDLTRFLSCWGTEKSLLERFENLRTEKAQSEQKKALLKEQIEELIEANLKEEENEDALFEEYTLLANARELLTQSSQALEEVDVARQCSTKIQNTLQVMEKYALDLKEASKMIKEAQLLFEEMQIALQSFQAKLESDPGRLLYLEEHLRLLDHLKKKYGQNPLKRRKEMEDELEAIESLDEKEEGLKKALIAAKRDTAAEARFLRETRTKGAAVLEQKLSIALKKLNIQAAKIKIQVLPAMRTKTGEDEVIFYLRANKGEQEVSVRESSSGGELSRLLFALKIVLAEKGRPKTMVFDEIDANVGGETARLIGEQLKKLGISRQVLCITHFPQVARQGDHHICVSKSENKERTEGQIKMLSKKEREVELLRMLGGAMAPYPHPL
ncbi:MAG: DNA repair protein RecN [Chlamydiae bacterium]|nr:DNA repair protein RecN [Chlamydiota bacterium]